MPTKKKSTTKKKVAADKKDVVTVVVKREAAFWELAIAVLAGFVLGSLLALLLICSIGSYNGCCHRVAHRCRPVVKRMIPAQPAQVEKAPCTTCGEDAPWNPNKPRQPKPGEVSPRGY